MKIIYYSVQLNHVFSRYARITTFLKAQYLRSFALSVSENHRCSILRIFHLDRKLLTSSFFLQERGALLFLRYAGRWGAYAVKNRLNLSSSVPGRHGEKFVCPCQFIEEHLKTKPPAGLAKFFMLPNQNVQLY